MVFVLLSLAAPAHAAFPGQNGKIVFYSLRSPGGWYVMNPDGSAPVHLANGGVWSADGKKFVCGDGSESVCTANADGTNFQEFYLAKSINRPMWSPDGSYIVFSDTTCGADFCEAAAIDFFRASDAGGGTRLSGQFDYDPAWSPDGRKIAFSSERNDPTPRNDFGVPCSYCNYEIYTLNADGTDAPARLTSAPGEDRWPSWSPDGSKIVFTSTRDDPNAPGCGSVCKTEIYVMNADGTGQTRLTNNQADDRYPSWSPDGRKILFTSDRDGNSEIYVMNPDGTGQTNLTNNPASDSKPDWQPLPITYYPRPKGATPFLTYLSVAYKPCPAGSENRQHGAPLAGDSCSPPVQASDHLTVGTLDSNGQKANAIGSVRYDVKVGGSSVPADVKLAVSVTDVRNKSDLSDYTGELLASATRRITDKNNTPAPDGTTEAATVADIPFSATVPCAATSDTTIGSSCALATTANALVPGQVVANMRSIWQLDQVKLYDGGADGQASTSADNTLFMDEGIFGP